MELAEIKGEVYWIELFTAGNELALDYFFKLHYHPLRYFATSLVHEPMEAEDIVAGCFSKLWEKRSDFSNAENIKGFLYVTCRNYCFQFLRNLKRRNAAQQLYFEQLEQSERTVLNEIIEAELLNILEQEIILLPGRCSEVFRLIYFEGKNTNEIALQLDLSVQTVRNHKTRALELLKTAFLKRGVKDALILALLTYLGRS